LGDRVFFAEGFGSLENSSAVSTDAMALKSQAKKSERTREKILMAAMELFAERGLTATNVRDIAARANISMGLMYHYFKTKEDMFTELIAISAEEVQTLNMFSRQDISPLVALEQMVDEVVKDLKTDYSLSQWTVMLMQPIDNTKKSALWHELIDNHRQLYIDAFATLIKRGQAGDYGFKQGDPLQLAQFAYACIQGICALQLSLKEQFVVPTSEILKGVLVE